MLKTDIEVFYRSLWPTTVKFSILEPFPMRSVILDNGRMSYKLLDDNVISLCTIKFLWWNGGGGLGCFGGNSKKCLKTRGN